MVQQNFGSVFSSNKQIPVFLYAGAVSLETLEKTVRSEMPIDPVLWPHADTPLVLEIKNALGICINFVPSHPGYQVFYLLHSHLGLIGFKSDRKRTN